MDEKEKEILIELLRILLKETNKVYLEWNMLLNEIIKKLDLN